MTEPSTPRGMIKALLKGELPARPLLMPTIFSLGSRLEGLPLRDFQRNPTKIANALRQIHKALKVDGLACYFDPFLEVEALGGTLDWLPNGSATLADCPYAGLDDLGKLPSPEQVIQKGRIRVAADVLHRMRMMLHDDPALMAGVTGPLTLARQLLGEASGEIPLELLQYASEVSAAICRNFLESGADVIFLTESSLPQMSRESWEFWASLLDPIINVIRFYESLPVLLLKDGSGPREDLWPMLARDWSCALCPAVAGAETAIEQYRMAERTALGIAVPTSFGWRTMSETGTSVITISQVLREEKAVLLISSGDLPSGSDLKQLTSFLDVVRTSVLRAA
jgi:uroporphyrinogen-III decarboxylase